MDSRDAREEPKQSRDDDDDGWMENLILMHFGTHGKTQ